MTIAVDLGRKATKQTNNVITCCMENRVDTDQLDTLNFAYLDPTHQICVHLS